MELAGGEMRLTFRAYPASVKATFACVKCGKEKRSRTFRSDCTCNPFNKKDDGSVRTTAEVSAQSQAEANEMRARFLTEPVCATCENGMSYSELAAIAQRRRAAIAKATGATPTNSNLTTGANT